MRTARHDSSRDGSATPAAGPEGFFLEVALPEVDRAALSRLLRAATELNNETSLPLHDALVALADAVERAPTAGAAADERARFITANAELGLLAVRQGYALRVLRDAAAAALDASNEAHALRKSVTPEEGAPDLDVNAWVRDLRAAEGRAAEAAKALRAAIDDAEEDASAAQAAHERLVAERDRLQRACDEGLPREVIRCPKCGAQHLEWFRHDAPGIDGRKRPHHTHRCYHCEHVWDSGRWSFGAERSTGVAAERDEARAQLDALTLAVSDRAEALRRVPAATLRAHLAERGWALAGRQNTLDGSPRTEHWHWTGTMPAGVFAARLDVILCDGVTTAWQSIATVGDVEGRAPELVLAELVLRAEHTHPGSGEGGA